MRDRKQIGGLMLLVCLVAIGFWFIRSAAKNANNNEAPPSRLLSRGGLA
jgi:hypothetical protein